MIVSLQSDIMDINEIFKDLGMMIHEQGDVIGKPNSNIIWKVISCLWGAAVQKIYFAGKIPLVRMLMLKQIRCNLIGRLR